MSTPDGHPEKVDGFEVIRDPACPPGTIYMLNERQIVVHQHVRVPSFSRWERFKRWVRRILGHGVS